MSITGSFDVHVGGMRLATKEVARFSIHSTVDNRQHRYRITSGDLVIEGTLPKTYSGHGNILHLLKAILDDVRLDSLGTDYSSIRKGAAKPAILP